MNITKLNDSARQLIGSVPATLVTINRDGSPQVSLVWVTVQTTADGGEELVTAHLQEHQKIRNIRRDPRVAVTIASADRSGPQTPYLSIRGTARIEEGGAPELLDEIATSIFGRGTGSLRPMHPWLPDSHHDRESRRRGPMGGLNVEFRSRRSALTAAPRVLCRISFRARTVSQLCLNRG